MILTGRSFRLAARIILNCQLPFVLPLNTKIRTGLDYGPHSAAERSLNDGTAD